MATSNQSNSGSSTSDRTKASTAGKNACAIPAFSRSHFYTGKLLTETDLTREQRYTIDKLRLHYVALHGWGVACGLIVEPQPQCADRIVVSAGFAVDDCGREIRLVKDSLAMMPKPLQPLPNPCEPQDDNCDEEEESSSVPKLEEQTYYVCIRYGECKEDFMPVIFADCCGATNQPNRVSECAVIEILNEPPECMQEFEHRKHSKHPENCHEFSEQLPEECPPAGRGCCIPLAIIRRYIYGAELTEEMIDNSVRLVMPSIPRLEALIRCAVEHLPKHSPRLTHIAGYNWEHDREYRPGLFLQDFIGTYEMPKSLTIEFDARVHADGLTNRTFQAMIIRHPRESHEPRHVELAPARVSHSEDGRYCSLHIDPEYARQHCHEHNFDLVVTLRCDKVIDERGIPVDGNLLAGLHKDEQEYALMHPTGNGVPGGLFESWIRVRRDK